MASGMLPDQPNNTKRAKVLHPPYVGEVFQHSDASRKPKCSCLFVGASLDPDHSPGDPEQREHEHPAWISEQGLHHQAPGESIIILQSL